MTEAKPTAGLNEAKQAELSRTREAWSLRFIVLMADREQFGTRLRREREKRGLSLDGLAETTKVSVDLWIGLEQNDLSRWPSGIFARAFVRDYAGAIGLDADAVVNEFCRHYPQGDRRVSRIVKAQGELIGHKVESSGEPLPAGRERRRRADDAPPPQVAPVYTARAVAAAIDAGCLCIVGVMGVTLVGAGFLSSVGLFAPAYFTAPTILTGASVGTGVVAALRVRSPSLFTSRGAVNA
jgi:transcriptional regulator with XRE-family HTH domain